MTKNIYLFTMKRTSEHTVCFYLQCNDLKKNNGTLQYNDLKKNIGTLQCNEFKKNIGTLQCNDFK